MKLVINSCYGGFGLSPKAIKRMAELNGRECFFFNRPSFKGPYVPADPDKESGIGSMMMTAFDIPNPNEVIPPDWSSLSDERRKESAELYTKHALDSRPERTDPLLIQTVEELGSEAASGACAKLKIIEIPDGIAYEIDEYDGIESVHEAHESWS